jgi:hypothetical protein
MVIIFRRGAGTKNRDGGLGRILRTIPIPQDTLDAIQSNDPLEMHPFHYDVDFVLGGKLSGVHRRELIYTSADAEGMTGDGGSMRGRRKRKPSSLALDAQDSAEPPQKKKGGAKKGQLATKKGDAPKGATKKEGKTPAAKRKPTGSKGTTAGAKKFKAEESVASEEANFIPKEVYEKHHREFERMVTRLEKIDQFGFFFGIEEHDGLDAVNDINQSIVQTISEHNTSCDKPVENESSSIDPASQSLNHVIISSAVGALLPPPVPTPPPPPFSRPPLCWEDIRKRREAGRYEMDRVKAIDEARRRRLGPYKAWKRKNKRETESLKPKVPKGMHPRVLNPKGVDWDLYREDVFAMCNAALAKDPDDGTGGSGTLGHAAKKIKDVSSGVRALR